MRKIYIIFTLIFTIFLFNSSVYAQTKTSTVKAIVVSEALEDKEDLIKTGIRITFWLFPVIIGIAIIKNINVGKDKK